MVSFLLYEVTPRILNKKENSVNFNFILRMHYFLSYCEMSTNKTQVENKTYKRLLTGVKYEKHRLFTPDFTVLSPVSN